MLRECLHWFCTALSGSEERSFWRKASMRAWRVAQRVRRGAEGSLRSLLDAEAGVGVGGRGEEAWVGPVSVIARLGG